jgi:flagellar biosynthesis chaperone FliJ
MRSSRDNRLRAWQLVIRKAAWELEALKTEGHWARDVFSAAEQSLKQAQDDVASRENAMREALTGTDGLSLEGLSRQRAFLMQQVEILNQKRTECDQARETLDTVTEQLKRRQLALKGLEHGKERSRKGLQQESDRRHWQDIDEAFVLARPPEPAAEARDASAGGLPSQRLSAGPAAGGVSSKAPGSPPSSSRTPSQRLPGDSDENSDKIAARVTDSGTGK